jgi:hypothetical protein
MALTVVHLVAFGFLIIGLLNLAIYWGKTHRDHTSMGVFRTLWLSLPVPGGMVLLVFSSRIAHWIQDYFDLE